MMNLQMPVRPLATLVVVCLLGMLPSATALAHDGPPRLELNTDRLPPGATLEVRGANLGADLPVVVALVRLGGQVQLGEAIGDAHGDFRQAFALPTNLAPGGYLVRATSTDGTIVEASVTIDGVPILAEPEGGRQRDERDVLTDPSFVNQAPAAAPDFAPIQPLAPPLLAAATSGAVEMTTLIGPALLAVVIAVMLRRRARGAR